MPPLSPLLPMYKYKSPNPTMMTNPANNNSSLLSTHSSTPKGKSSLYKSPVTPLTSKKDPYIPTLLTLSEFRKTKMKSFLKSMISTGSKAIYGTISMSVMIARLEGFASKIKYSSNKKYNCSHSMSPMTSMLLKSTISKSNMSSKPFKAIL